LPRPGASIAACPTGSTRQHFYRDSNDLAQLIDKPETFAHRSAFLFLWGVAGTRANVARMPLPPQHQEYRAHKRDAESD
jgi:hypothetical protein